MAHIQYFFNSSLTLHSHKCYTLTKEDNTMDDWRINLRLPAELKEPLKKKAKSEDRSVNSMILTIIKKYLEEDGK